MQISKKIFVVIMVAVIGFSTASCSHSNKLTVAFTKMGDLMTGSAVRAAGLPIGYVADLRPNKKIDTIFVILKINHKIKLPRGSQFYLDENPIGSSIINVEFSNSKTYLNSKDVSTGIFRTTREKYPRQFDTAMNQVKFLSMPKADSAKNR